MTYGISVAPRTALYAPASSERMLTKAMTAGADIVIIDLEDSVADDRKALARAQAVAALAQPSGVVRWARVNTVDSPYFAADLDAMLRAEVDAVVLPKADAGAFRALDAALADHELRTGRPAPRIVLLIETARGLIDVSSVCASTDRLIGLQLGAEDLTADLGIERTAGGSEIAYARSVVAVAAHAFGLIAMDTPSLRLDDAESLRADVHTARGLGLTAKACIHPSQLTVVQRAFAPSSEDIDHAREIIAAHEAAVAAGRGAHTVRGRMIDAPVVNRARAVLGAHDAHNSATNPAEQEQEV